MDLYNSVSVTTLFESSTINVDLPFFLMKGMLATRHRKQLSSSLIKEPILLKCQYNPSTGTTPTKGSQFI